MTAADLAITGSAVWTPAGDLDATIAAVTAGHAAPPPQPPAPDRSRTARLLGTLPAIAVDVARTAARELPAGDRTGVFLAHGGLRAHWDDLAPAMTDQSADATASWTRGLKRLHPLWMLRYLSNGAQAAIAHELGLRGDGATFSGPASAASALVSAAAAIAAGAIDHALVVALDDLTALEAAASLAARHPARTPSLGVAALAVGKVTKVTTSGFVRAADGIDPVSDEPDEAAIAAVVGRLPDAGRRVAWVERIGDLGAAALLIDVAIAARIAEGSVVCTAAGSPGQIGAVHVAREETRNG
jgi:hypothetical protein